MKGRRFEIGEEEGIGTGSKDVGQVNKRKRGYCCNKIYKKDAFWPEEKKDGITKEPVSFFVGIINIFLIIQQENWRTCVYVKDGSREIKEGVKTVRDIRTKWNERAESFWDARILWEK